MSSGRTRRIRSSISTRSRTPGTRRTLPRGRVIRGTGSSVAISPIRMRSIRSSRSAMRSSISRPNRTSTGRSWIPVSSSGRTCSGRRFCSNRHGGTAGNGSTTCRPTRCSDRSARMTRRSPNRRRTIRGARTAPRRHRRIISSVHIFTRTAFRSRFPTARTTTARTTSRRSLSRSS